MLIVDAQAHIWGADSPARPWPKRERPEPHREQPLGAEQLLQEMDGAGVARCVLVPPSWEGDRNELALAAAARYPDRFAVMGRFPVESPGPLKAWCRQPGMLGARLTLHRDPWRAWFRQGRLDWFWPAAEEAGIPVMLYAPGLLAELGALAGEHRGLRLILDHLGLPLGQRDEAAFAGLDELLALARHPNVAVKASALPCHSSEGYPFTGLHRHLRRVFDAFGPERMLWGSDLSRLPCTYREALALFAEALGFLSPGDKEWILGRAALRWLSWER